jgi:outer membrane lipoprotein SlyB
LAGGFYGAGAGGIIGAVIGNGVSHEQAKAYSDRLSNGDYLVMIDGTDEEIHRAESILGGQGIQDWGVYNSAT